MILSDLGNELEHASRINGIGNADKKRAVILQLEKSRIRTGSFSTMVEDQDDVYN